MPSAASRPVEQTRGVLTCDDCTPGFERIAPILEMAILTSSRIWQEPQISLYSGPNMEAASRHQCLIYEGAPSQHLAAVAAVAREKLAEGFRCLYLNPRPMVAGMRSYLFAQGVDVEREVGRGSLVLSSEQDHLVDGKFDIDRMMETLGKALVQALGDGYAGLWASGDMTWEMGPDEDFSKLVEYEARLEEFFHEHAEMSGICQYHASTLPAAVVRRGLLTHRSVFINETLSLVNPYAASFGAGLREAADAELDALVLRLCQAQGTALAVSQRVRALKSNRGSFTSLTMTASVLDKDF